MIKSSVANRVALVELARLDKKNALTADMYGQLADAIGGADKDPQVRVVLLRGSRDCLGILSSHAPLLVPHNPGARPGWL